MKDKLLKVFIGAVVLNVMSCAIAGKPATSNDNTKAIDYNALKDNKTNAIKVNGVAPEDADSILAIVPLGTTVTTTDGQKLMRLDTSNQMYDVPNEVNSNSTASSIFKVPVDVPDTLSNTSINESSTDEELDTTPPAGWNTELEKEVIVPNPDEEVEAVFDANGENAYSPSANSANIANQNQQSNIIQSSKSLCDPTNIKSFDYHTLSKCIEKNVFDKNYSQLEQLLKLQINSKNSVLVVAKNSLLLAESFYEQGRYTEASRVIEDFLVFKPVLEEMLDSAEVLENKYYAKEKELLKNSEKILKDLTNIVATNGSYNKAKPYIDILKKSKSESMIANAIKIEKDLTSKELVEAQNLVINIQDLVIKQLKFKEAEDKNIYLNGRYAYLKEVLSLDTMTNFIEKNKSKYTHLSVNSQSANAKIPKIENQTSDTKTNENNSNNLVAQPQGTSTTQTNPIVEIPEAQARAIFEKAINLAKEKKYLEAKKIFQPLLVSQFRSKLLSGYQAIGDEYCQEQRKISASAFAKSRNTSQSAKKKTELTKAITHLDNCLTEFPESQLIPKVRSNKNLLVKQLEEIK